ncbi:MAG: ATP-dependent protease [Rhodocyclales bacterium GWA2_65_20]|nr:MAG: ATP-dependent protease [Rhodocyclales bacterium GWA2_65_20]
MTDYRLLAPAELCRYCDPAQLGFATTAELADGIDVVGQERALDAARFAIDIKRPGFNLFVLGEPGSGRHHAIRRLLDAKAAEEAAPDDWCYVNNFAESERPRLLRLPPGMGQRFRHDMQHFIAELGPAITATFESDEFHTRIEAIQEEFKEREEGALRELGHAAGEQGVALLRTPQGFVFAPMKGDATMGSEEFEQLAEEEKERLSKVIEEFGERLHKLMHQFPRWRREMQVKIRAASREAMGLAAGHLIEELKDSYQDFRNVLEFLDETMHDVVEIGEDIHEQSHGEGEGVEFSGSISLRRYQVNLLIDHAATKSAPVVFEDNPIYPNLVGRVEQIAHMGMLVTNFTMIRAGALHRANGGYLMLDAIKVLMQPYAWEGLKRALKSRQVRVESLGQAYGLVSTESLEPEPVPLAVKVVLLGDRYTYYLLRELDPEFDELFKVAADFEDTVARDDGNSQLYARLVATVAQRDGLRPFEAGAVARVVEHAARLAGDAEKLSASTRRIVDLLHEADHRAGAAQRQAVGREDVEAALAARRERAGRLRRNVYEHILRGIHLIAVDGGQVGQVNGLAVVDPGDDMFGHPVRITATARLGEGEVIDIEREAELGGAIHSKGVMILASFLAARYANSMPLSLGASLVFEQSYGPVEGDSASLAELCALLSALANVPIRQSVAVTGSVNQHGRVQAIGGVNEKIEGFFDICQARGLNGEQGVVIPASNVKHLMLKDEVVAACAAGRFRIWAADSVDAAIELLTGVPAGEPNAEGLIAENSINFLVAVRLATMSELRREFGAAARKRRKKAESDKPPG